MTLRRRIARLESRFRARNARLTEELGPEALDGMKEAIDRLSAYLAEATDQPEAAPSTRR